MDEQTLPVRLRELSDALAAHGADDLAFRGGAVIAMREAADELERLQGELAGAVGERDIAEHGRDYLAERLATAVLDGPQALEPPTGRPLVDALEVLAALELHGEQHAPTGTERAARGGTHAGGLRAAAAIVRDLAGLDGDAPLAELGRELAGDAGVPAPMPVSRRFAVWLAEGWDRPSPGSFVFAGPALAVWRVLDVEAVPVDSRDVAIATHDSEDGKRWPVHVLLEAVDAHDVPTTARVAELPLPVVEVHDADPAGAGS